VSYATSEAVIEVRDLSKQFGNIAAVDGISFSAKRATTTALLGGNGAGKTTTIAMLLGLLLPTAGSIRILGEDMLHHRYKLLHRMNFSSPYVDLPHRLTVAENLRIYARLYGLRRSAERVQEIAERLDLTALLKRRTGSLSAGQRTRVALAKALINEPEVLLLDEPTASLDPESADWIRDYLQRYAAEKGATILLASHNMAEVERLAHDVVMLRQGRVVDTGAPAALLERYGRDTMEEVFLAIARGAGKDDGNGRRAAE
jgi:ABC-2 type transport system ATP-binding protein